MVDNGITSMYRVHMVSGCWNHYLPFLNPLFLPTKLETPESTPTGKRVCPVKMSREHILKLRDHSEEPKLDVQKQELFLPRSPNPSLRRTPKPAVLLRSCSGPLGASGGAPDPRTLPFCPFPLLPRETRFFPQQFTVRPGLARCFEQHIHC